ncbi:MAG TPA: lytic murein transglycosylase [Acidimicrobiales bacterium]|nr:lytic murein transglycosylase [Acidimicrobiales bacterium]
MAGRRGRAARTAVAAATVMGGLLGGPAGADEAQAPAPAETTSTTEPETTTTSTTAPPANTLTILPETKILSLTPAATTTTTAAPRPVPPAPRPSSPAPAPSVRADSPALRALVEANAAERRRLAGEIAGAESRVTGMEGVLAATRSALSEEEAWVASAEVAAGQARAAVDQASGRVAQLEASAAAAAEAMQVRRTPVARPPARGHTPQDAAVAARQSLEEAVTARGEAVRTLADREQELAAARRTAGTTSADLVEKLAELSQARDALEGLRKQLLAAEQSTPTLDDGGDVTLVPAPSALATATVPTGWLPLYGRAAATCPGLPWQVLAAVGSVESAHGQSTAPGVRDGANFAGAMGPMQFLAGTWAAYSADGDGDGVRNVYDPDDAVFGAARYLCASGGGKTETLRAALWAYNHADWYVEMVLELASRY